MENHSIETISTIVKVYTEFRLEIEGSTKQARQILLSITLAYLPPIKKTTNESNDKSDRPFVTGRPKFRLKRSVISRAMKSVQESINDCSTFVCKRKQPACIFACRWQRLFAGSDRVVTWNRSRNGWPDASIILYAISIVSKGWPRWGHPCIELDRFPYYWGLWRWR